MNRFLALSVFVCGLLIAPQAQASSLYLDPATATINPGDTIKVAVRLDTNEEAGECINAVDGVVNVSDNLELLDVSIGSSIFSMWVEQPTINKASHQVTFAGGIPNGYCGRVEGDPRLSNVITELIVRAPLGNTASGTVGDISFAPESTVYLNDGFGTPASPQLYNSLVTITDTPGSEINDEWKLAVEEDTVPPAWFAILLSQNPAGKYVVSFNSTDKQTGVDHYEVMEQPLEQFGTFTWGRANAPWVTARSPYELKDQSLNSAIYVKAIDKAGNETISTLVPETSMRTLSTNRLLSFVLWGVLAVLLVAGGVVIFALRKHRRRNAQTISPVHDESTT
ncbi:hypothetical protein KC887_00085 [Candidatus Kaiserbacteria bacterium]|nr:hypothetical protein [Candidatus Kaiserbacteria bacterium]